MSKSSKNNNLLNEVKSICKDFNNAIVEFQKRLKELDIKYDIYWEYDYDSRGVIENSYGDIWAELETSPCGKITAIVKIN